MISAHKLPLDFTVQYIHTIHASIIKIGLSRYTEHTSNTISRTEP
jgi:hypothetical protein